MEKQPTFNSRSEQLSKHILAVQKLAESIASEITSAGVEAWVNNETTERLKRVLGAGKTDLNRE